MEKDSFYPPFHPCPCMERYNYWPFPPKPLHPPVPPRPAGFRREAPLTCEPMAVIPTIEIADKSELKSLYNCLVHVSNINTTYYIDDKGRIITTWAGPVIASDYDYEANPLELRSQEVWDFKNKRVIKYSETGETIVIEGA